MRYVKTITGRYQQVTNEQLRAMRYVPKNATPIAEDGGVVYVYPYNAPMGGRYYGVIAYRGNAHKSEFHYTYKTDAQVDKKIAEFFQSIRDHKKRVADRRAQDNAGHTFKVGEIVTNSWGYDQTNVDWYAVTRITKNYVWLRPVCAELESATGAMSGKEALVLDANLKPIFTEKGVETKHKASGDYVTMRHGCGSRYKGGSLHSS